MGKSACPVIIRANGHSLRGLPRPLAPDDNCKLKPVPWTNSPARWGVLDEGRAQMCTALSMCLVCGEQVGTGRIIVRRYRHDDSTPTFADKSMLSLWAEDGGPLHERCFRLTEAHCEWFAGAILDGRVAAIHYEEVIPTS